MTEESEGHLKLSNALKFAFTKHQDWSLEEAAWLIVGYSTLTDPMTPIRLADDVKIVFGTTEYREAKAAQKEIEDKLVEGIMRSGGIHRRGTTHLDDQAPWRSRFTNLRLLDMATSGLHMRGNERIDIPWLKLAFDYGLIPGDFVGRPGVRNHLGRASVKATSTATASGEVIKPKKLFEMKDRSEFKDTFHEWVYNQLNEHSEQGKKRPTLSQMKKIITEKKPGMFLKFGKNSKDSKAAKSVYYWDDQLGEETSMTEDALKQFILDVTYEAKKD